jgi:hypothetical protein
MRRSGQLGVWCTSDGLPANEAAEFAARTEELGHLALWLPEVAGRDPFAHITNLV